VSENYYALKINKVFELLKSSKTGLTSSDSKRRLQKYGPNELEKGKKISAFQIFVNQFKNALILLLIGAGVLSLFLGETVESIAMFGIVLLNAILGFVQEFRAEKAIEALQKISAPTAKVLRNGKQIKIAAKDVVPGDILLLEEGDIVPADSRIFESHSMQIDEACLTGESVPSKKIITPYKVGTSIASQENMAFMSTIVTYGKGRSIVTGTGMNTEFGKIAKSLETTVETKTPLQTKFQQMAKQIGIISLGLILIVFVAGIWQGAMSWAEMLLVALALTVSTIPNSLPVIVTVGLSVGTKKLAKKNMLIRKLPAAESLGAATIICSDKTGTITKNQMTVTDVYFDNKKIKVTGSGYNPVGDFLVNSKKISAKNLELLLRIGYLCNNAKLNKKANKYKVVGDPTEGSLIVLGKKAKLEEEYMHKHFTLVEELPFDSNRKKMSVIFKNKINNKNEAYVKGAPDLLVQVCDRIYENGKIRKITKKDKNNVLKMNNAYASNALRVLGMAYKEVKTTKYSIDNIEKGLIFIGLVGMIDPPREEVKKSIKQCQTAGIKVMIITGDHSVTAKAVAEKIGLFKKGDLVLSGEEMEKLSDSELEKKIDKIRIVARALPIQKSRIVNALQKRGHVVAMTGDGVNDAPALKKADIGIAMGITGTDVSKEVSDTTLVDDDFSSIVTAIGIGRNIYDKMIKSAKYLLSCNAGEVTAVLIAVLLKFPLPLLPLQILLMSLLTDDLPALGLGLESAEEGIMKRMPRNPKEKPITTKMLISILVFGLIMGLGTLFVFNQYKDINLVKAQTMAFSTLVMFQMFAVMSSRSLLPSFKKLNPFSNLWLIGAVSISLIVQAIVIYWRPMQIVFGTTGLVWMDIGKILIVSFLGFVMMEVSKFALKIGNGKAKA
tara:strand:- start:143 stop:2824 length:2682 start_codon:yes stop_codon:yes gene_type:complete